MENRYNRHDVPRLPQELRLARPAAASHQGIHITLGRKQYVIEVNVQAQEPKPAKVIDIGQKAPARIPKDNAPRLPE